VNAASARSQIDTITIWPVGQHERTRKERMWFNDVVFNPISILESNQISLATERAAIAGNINS
jgi:hypothetical protein